VTARRHTRSDGTPAAAPPSEGIRQAEAFAFDPAPWERPTTLQSYLVTGGGYYAGTPSDTGQLTPVECIGQ